MEILPDSQDSLRRALDVLMDFVVLMGPEDTSRIVEASPSTELFVPFRVALQKEWGGSREWLGKLRRLPRTYGTISRREDVRVGVEYQSATDLPWHAKVWQSVVDSHPEITSILAYRSRLLLQSVRSSRIGATANPSGRVGCTYVPGMVKRFGRRGSSTNGWICLFWPSILATKASVLIPKRMNRCLLFHILADC